MPMVSKSPMRDRLFRDGHSETRSAAVRRGSGLVPSKRCLCDASIRRPRGGQHTSPTARVGLSIADCSSSQDWVGSSGGFHPPLVRDQGTMSVCEESGAGTSAGVRVTTSSPSVSDSTVGRKSSCPSTNVLMSLRSLPLFFRPMVDAPNRSAYYIGLIDDLT